MVPILRIELRTSTLPRLRSTTEPHGQNTLKINYKSLKNVKTGFDNRLRKELSEYFLAIREIVYLKKATNRLVSLKKKLQTEDS